MNGADATARARAALLEVVAADRDARCRAILAPAEAEAAARLAAALQATRRGLRRALAGEREALRAQVNAALAQRDAALRQRHQRLAQAAVDEGWALLASALCRRWQEPQTRQCWIAAALDVARARLPPGGWSIRHPPGMAPAETAAMQQALAAQGVSDARCEAAAGIAAGIEIRVGDACLDATVDGLLADRAAVAGRLVHFWEETPAPAPAASGAADDGGRGRTSAEET
ncbi:hypothetical protein AZOA_47010 [Azoarcus sp. Aa7]|nr:hypothetical protein [Azoarcus sp. Aa7]